MKTSISLLAIVLCTGLVVAGEPAPKEALLTASKTLAAKPNYSWKTSVEAPDQPTGTIEGKTEKEGATSLTLARGEVSFDGVLKGTKGAVKTEEGWKSLSDTAEDGSASGAARFVARLLQNFKAPPAEVADLAAKTKDLKLTEDAYAGTLTEDAVKELLLFRTRSGGNGPEVSSAKGSAKFWLKDGSLSKYELKLEGTISSNGNERDVVQTRTTEIRDVGATKVSVPEEAAKKL